MCVAPRVNWGCPGEGRPVRIHRQDRLPQAARALQASPEFGECREKRQAAEHRLARLAKLGIRKARHVGQAETLVQVVLSATVANLTLTATKMKRVRPGSGANAFTTFDLSLLSRAFEVPLPVCLRRLGPMLRIPTPFRLPQPTFRLDFWPVSIEGLGIQESGSHLN
jgi:hypothetical protein